MSDLAQIDMLCSITKRKIQRLTTEIQEIEQQRDQLIAQIDLVRVEIGNYDALFPHRREALSLEFCATTRSCVSISDYHEAVAQLRNERQALCVQVEDLSSDAQVLEKKLEEIRLNLKGLNTLLFKREYLSDTISKQDRKKLEIASELAAEERE